MLAIAMGLLLTIFSAFDLEETKSRKNTSQVQGKITYKKDAVPFSNIRIQGTTRGVASNAQGEYVLSSLPSGKWTLVVQTIGYKTVELPIELKENERKQLDISLEEDLLGLDEVTITGDRDQIGRKESTSSIAAITRKMFVTTQAITLNESLNYTPGLRLENNCQNCGFTQVRMNGLEGPYTQILINSRPVFSNLAGVYGLEFIPTNMIERIEVVRGGGSALYGGNAIAGTINLILKDPVSNSFEFGYAGGAIGVGYNSPAPDQSIHLNASVISDDYRSGLTAYGFYRNRMPFDANGDDFSETSKINNTTFGTRLFHRMGERSKVTGDFFIIDEDRRGGNKFENLPHETDITEAAKHQVLTGDLSFEHFFRDIDLLSVYSSVQNVNRHSYYGANYAQNAYGKTKSLSSVLGATYKRNYMHSNITVGSELQSESLLDRKLGYTENAVHVENTTLVNQASQTWGSFIQYEYSWKKIKWTTGLRYSNYSVGEPNESTTKGTVFSPRINVLIHLNESWQFRTSYSQGYRAPQIFDEDLHVETSGSRQVFHVNAPDLKQETSHSFMGSFDWDKNVGSVKLEFLLEGFYTLLINPFANAFGTPDSSGTVIYTRINAKDGAHIGGVNTELTVIPTKSLNLRMGFTLQQSKYDVAQEFDERRFFRTPNAYGFLAADYTPSSKWGFSLTGNYTGSMLIPYHGPMIANSDLGELRTSQKFYDLGMKVRRYFNLGTINLEAYAGVKNILNSYQSDFDQGIDRDPTYIYGPTMPRYVYGGVNIKLQ